MFTVESTNEGDKQKLNLKFELMEDILKGQAGNEKLMLIIS